MKNNTYYLRFKKFLWNLRCKPLSEKQLLKATKQIKERINEHKLQRPQN